MFLNHSFCIRQKVFIVPIVILFFSFSFTFQCEMNAKDIFLLFGDVIWSENRHFSSDRKTTTTSTNWGQFPFNSFGIFSSKTWHLTNLLFCCCKKPYLVFSWESCFFVQYFKQNRSNHNFTILFLMAQYFLMNKNKQKDGIQINNNYLADNIIIWHVCWQVEMNENRFASFSFAHFFGLISKSAFIV